MSHYHLIVHVGSDGPVRTLSVNLKSRDEAFIVAQRYTGPSELWYGDEKLCNINHADSGVWVLSG